MLPLTALFLLLHFLRAGARKVLVVPHTPGQDDTPALTALLPQYSSDATILFQEGTTYNIFTPISFPYLKNVEIAIEGNLTYPSSISAVQAIVGSSSFPGAWFAFQGGKNVILRGSLKNEWGWVDGHGQAWWDARALNNRPRGWGFHGITNGVIKDMKLWKPIAGSFSTDGTAKLHAYNNKILAVSDTTFPSANTDGFNIGSGANSVFENNFIKNGDDCLSVLSGAKNIHIRNTYCEGGHGVSIGSLGGGRQAANVENVLIENIVFKHSMYAARFKSWAGGSGLARNITWRNISYSDVLFPIYITQHYLGQGPLVGHMPQPSQTKSVGSVHLQDFLFEQFVGTVRDTTCVEGTCISNPCWNSAHGSKGREILTLDLIPGTATNIVAKNIYERTATASSPVGAKCNVVRMNKGASFVCRKQKFVHTAAGC